jgi:hypothetical protein
MTPEILAMSEALLKALTEWMGECWHKPVIEDYDSRGIWWSCGKCGNRYRPPEHRTFDTPDDFFALVKRLRETGKWEEFILFADRIWADDPASVPWFVSGDEPQIVPFTDWILDPARFAGLVAEWLKKEER